MSAPKVCIAPRCPNLTTRTRCATHETEAEMRRGNAADRGYDARWQRTRARYLRRHPMCQIPGCPEAATDVDHTPTRRELVKRGVPDPDAERYLTGLCHPHHSQKTARENGLGRG